MSLKGCLVSRGEFVNTREMWAIRGGGAADDVSRQQAACFSRTAFLPCRVSFISTYKRNLSAELIPARKYVPDRPITINDNSGVDSAALAPGTDMVSCASPPLRGGRRLTQLVNQNFFLVNMFV